MNCTDLVVIGLEVERDHRLVSSESLLKVGERVARDPKRRVLDVMRESVEFVHLDEHLGQRFVAEHIAEDHPRIERDIFVLIP